MSTTQGSGLYPFALITPLKFAFLLIACSIFKVLCQVIYYRFSHPPRHFPGPSWASGTRLWIAYHNIKANECEIELALQRKHGPVLRIALTLLEMYNRQSNKSIRIVRDFFMSHRVVPSHLDVKPLHYR